MCLYIYIYIHIYIYAYIYVYVYVKHLRVYLYVSLSWTVQVGTAEGLEAFWWSSGCQAEVGSIASGLIPDCREIALHAHSNCPLLVLEITK